MKSIMQDKKECYITGSTGLLHRHHVFGGGNRQLSEKYGLTVYLIPELHNMSDEGVHFNIEFDLKLKQDAQRKAMEYYGWTVNNFIRRFGRNYL